jgi:hypothetical protein
VGTGNLGGGFGNTGPGNRGNGKPVGNAGGRNPGNRKKPNPVTWSPFTGSVFVGTNEFRNCGVVISIAGTTLFQFHAGSNGAFAVDLHVKDPSSAADRVLIQRDVSSVLPAGATYVNRGGTAELRWNGTVIFRAVYSTTAVHVDLDLRPLRVNLYTDGSGSLYVGGSRMAGNLIANCGVGLWVGTSVIRMG